MNPDQQLARLLEGRTSTRGFLPEPLPQESLDALFAMAQRSPSWCNIQPWRLVLTEGPMTKIVSEALLGEARKSLPHPDLDFPLVYPAPYDEHRKQCGGALYSAMGIPRQDKSKRYDAWLRNYEIFDAPHLLVVSRDERLGEYATLDIGVWLGTFLMAAESLGIHTCPMASIASYPEVLRKLLDIPENQLILFGVALGISDPQVAANSARTTRQPVCANLRQIKEQA